MAVRFTHHRKTFILCCTFNQEVSSFSCGDSIRCNCLSCTLSHGGMIVAVHLGGCPCVSLLIYVWSSPACCLPINGGRARTLACVLYRPDLGRGYRHPSITGRSMARTLGYASVRVRGGLIRESGQI
jgi:hypothetical protein